MNKHSKWLLFPVIAFIVTAPVSIMFSDWKLVLMTTAFVLVISLVMMISLSYADKKEEEEEAYKAYKERKEKELAEEQRKKDEERRAKAEEAYQARQAQLEEQRKKDEEARKARIDKINQLGFIEWYKQSVPDEELIDPLELDRYKYYEKRRQASGITDTLVLRREYDKVLEYRKSPEQRAHEEYLRNLAEENRRNEEEMRRIEYDRQYHEEQMIRLQMEHDEEMQDREDQREINRQAHNKELNQELIESNRKTAKYAAAYQSARMRGEDQSKASWTAWSESLF